MLGKLQSYGLGVAVVLSLTHIAGAQEFRATVRGQVVDASNAGVPGATVTVQNKQTSEVATTTTNAEGNYTVPFIRPGTYILTVELSGFQKSIRDNLTLEVNQTATINVQLEVASLTEQVSVVAERRCSKRATPTAARSSTAIASPSCPCSRAARWRWRRWWPASTTTPRPFTCARSTTAHWPTGR